MEHILLANNAAASQSTEEAGAITAKCPLMNSMIQLVPMRYAMSEKNEELPNNLNGSLYQEKNIPQGIRPLNPGFLYVIHSEDKETLYEYQVKKDQRFIGRDFKKGTQDFQNNDRTEIIVPRRGTLRTLFMPVAMTAERADILLAATQDQKSIMTRVLLGSIDPLSGSKGALPTGHIPTGIDFSAQIMASTSQDDTGLYSWLSELSWKADAQASVQSSVLPKYKEDSAVLLVNDICSDLAEVAERQTTLNIQYQTWFSKDVDGHKNCDRYQIATLLTSLMTADHFFASEIDSILKELGMKTGSKEEKQQCLQRLKVYAETLEDPDNFKVEKHTNYRGQIMYSSINPNAVSMETELKTDYGVSPEKLRRKMRAVMNQYRALIEGGDAGKKGLKDVIRYAEMTSFTQSWETYRKSMSEKLEQLNPYVKKIAPKWSLLAAYISPTKPEDLQTKLNYDDILTVFFRNNDDQWLQHYYVSQDEFPLLAVYDDIYASPDDTISKKDVVSIAQRFKSVNIALAEKSTFQAKLDTLNDLSQQNTISSTSLQARVQQSLAQKHDNFITAMTQALQTPDSNANFTQRIEASFDQLTPGAKQLLRLNFKAADIKWQLPDKNAAQQLETMHDKLDHTIADLKTSLVKIKQIKDQNISILKLSSPKRQTARAKYRQELLAEKNQKTGLIQSIQRQYDAILEHSGDAVSIGVGKHFSMEEQLQEARQLSQGLNPKGTLRELIENNGNVSHSKVAQQFASVVITGVQLWSAWHAWRNYLDDYKQDGELLAVLTTTGLASASVLTFATSVYKARLEASLRITEKTHYSGTLARLAKFSVYSSTFASYLGVYAFGIQTSGAISDMNDAWSDSFEQKTLSLFRAYMSAGNSGVAFYEAIRYTWTSIKLFRGVLSAEAAYLEMLSVSALSLWYGVVFWLAFDVADKLWLYYRWTPVMKWAYHTLWGEDDKQWSLTEHFEQLAPEMALPKASYAIINNTYHADDTGAAEMQLQLMLPQINAPTQHNCKVALTAFCLGGKAADGSFIPPKWCNVLNDLQDDVDIRSLTRGCELTFHLRSDWIYQKRIAQLQCRIAVCYDGQNWHEKGWDFRLQRVSPGVQENPNVLTVHQFAMKNAAGFSLIAWKE